MKFKRLVAAITAAVMGTVFIPNEIIMEGEYLVANALESVNENIVDVLMDNYNRWNKLALANSGYSAVGFLDIDFDNEPS